MKKKIAMLLAAGLTLCAGFSAVGCSSSGGKKEETDYIVPTALKKTETGRVYMEKNGKPFVYTGAAIRLDGYPHFQERTFEEMEEQFRLAAELGVNSVQVQIVWGDIEKQKDVYDFRQLRTMLEWAVEYGLYVDLLMGTPQECHWYLPDYIYEDEATYPKYQSTHKGAYWWNGYHGTMVYGHPNLIERETKFITAVTDFLYEWEKNNGNPNIVVSFGINNEPDGFVRWVLVDYELSLPDGSRRLTDKEAWEALYVTLEAEGRAYKESKYRAITRTNLIKLWENEYGLDTYARRMYDLGTIDIIGDDTYTESISNQTKAMNDLMTGHFANNFPHVAENSGAFENAASLVLSALMQGAGYSIYCLALPEGYVDPNDASYDYWEQGILDPVTWEDKAHTQTVRDVLHGINKAGLQVAVADLNQMKAFNTVQNFPQSELEETAQIGGRTITYKTVNGGLAYAIYYKGYTTVLATADCTMEFSGDAITQVQKGSFNDFAFVSEGDVTIEGNVLSLSAHTCYRLLTNPAEAAK